MLAPWTPPLTTESVTEIGVLLAKTPSVLVEPTVLRETVRPKLDELSVEVAPFTMLMPVPAYLTEAFTTVPLAVLSERLMPAQSPGAAAAQPGSSTDGQATTPALLSVRLVKIFCALDAVSSARSVTPWRLSTPPLPTLTMSPALTVRR